MARWRRRRDEMAARPARLRWRLPGSEAGTDTVFPAAAAPDQVDLHRLASSSSCSASSRQYTSRPRPAVPWAQSFPQLSVRPPQSRRLPCFLAPFGRRFSWWRRRGGHGGVDCVKAGLPAPRTRCSCAARGRHTTRSTANSGPPGLCETASRGWWCCNVGGAADNLGGLAKAGSSSKLCPGLETARVLTTHRPQLQNCRLRWTHGLRLASSSAIDDHAKENQQVK